MLGHSKLLLRDVLFPWSGRVQVAMCQCTTCRELPPGELQDMYTISDKVPFPLNFHGMILPGQEVVAQL